MSVRRRLRAELEEEHLYLRPRFSPGYGDFDICYQEPVVRMLNCAKTIGLTLTDSFMMTPTKSVTAVIGISTQKDRCPISGCEVCTKKKIVNTDDKQEIREEGLIQEDDTRTPGKRVIIF